MEVVGTVLKQYGSCYDIVKSGMEEMENIISSAKNESKPVNDFLSPLTYEILLSALFCTLMFFISIIKFYLIVNTGYVKIFMLKTQGMSATFMLPYHQFSHTTCNTMLTILHNFQLERFVNMPRTLGQIGHNPIFKSLQT